MLCSPTQPYLYSCMCLPRTHHVPIYLFLAWQPSKKQHALWLGENRSSPWADCPAGCCFLAAGWAWTEQLNSDGSNKQLWSLNEAPGQYFVQASWKSLISLKTQCLCQVLLKLSKGLQGTSERDTDTQTAWLPKPCFLRKPG